MIIKPPMPSGINIYQIPPLDKVLEERKELDFETWVSYQGEEYRNILSTKLAKKVKQYQFKRLINN
jgi:hypothetical protein